MHISNVYILHEKVFTDKININDNDNQQQLDF